MTDQRITGVPSIGPDRPSRMGLGPWREGEDLNVGAYPIKDVLHCPEMLFKDTLVDRDLQDPPTELGQALMDAGIRFEETVGDRIRRWAQRTGWRLVDIPPGREIPERNRRAVLTVEAMRSGAHLIWNGRLVPEGAGIVGEPDLLVRADPWHLRTPPSGTWRYLPVDVKLHRALSGSGRRFWMVTDLDGDAPLGPDAARRTRLQGRPSVEDVTQLVHSIWLLEHLGHAPDEPWGAIIGWGPEMVWIPLRGLRLWSLPGVSGRLDAEGVTGHLYRRVVTIHRAARAGTRPEGVHPWRTSWCPECRWRTLCGREREALRDVTLVPRVTRSTVGRLAPAGIRTVDDLAAADPGTWPGTGSPPGWWVSAVRQARVMVSGRPMLAPGRERVSVRRADVEIDLDIEDDQYLYLVGMLVTDRVAGTSRYVPVVCWEDTPAASAATVAAWWSWMVKMAAEWDRQGRSWAVYHYTGHEIRYFQWVVRNWAGWPGLPDPDTLDTHIQARWVDLYRELTRSLVLPVQGYGLKTVAKLAGMTWRDTAAGGGNSTVWHRQAVRDPDPGVRAAARRRLLDYNEDDVVATWRLREWMMSLEGLEPVDTHRAPWEPPPEPAGDGDLDAAPDGEPGAGSPPGALPEGAVVR